MNALRPRTNRRRPRPLRWLRTSVALGVLVLAGSAFAQSTGGNYRLDPQSIDAGGGRSTGGPFELNATIGQHDANEGQSGGSYALTSGFRRREGNPPTDALFGDGFESP